jgi:hypothetical protein
LGSHWPVVVLQLLVEQSPSWLQVVPHALGGICPEPPQTYGSHERTLFTQLPVPLHCGDTQHSVDVPHTPEPITEPHTCDPQSVPLWYSRHPPLPSHVPSCPHVLGLSVVQSPVEAPLFAFPQVPLLVPVALSAALHAWHVPAQAELQQ